MNFIENQTIAVIIAYYNGSKYIERALKSIENQTIPPDEVILVNDGSHETEALFLEQLQKKFCHIKIIHKKNGGQGSARNLGVKAAKSQFITFLDQDDFYLENHIEDLRNALPKNDLNFGFVYGDICIANEKGDILERGITKKQGPNPILSVIDYIKKDTFILPSAILVSKIAFLHIGGFDDRLRGCEDDDLYLRLFLKGYKSYFIEIIVTVWCLNRFSTSFSIHLIRSRFIFFKKLFDLFPDDLNSMKFYFADYIAPRFGNLFVSAALDAALSKSPNRNEINSFLNCYTNLLIKNKFVNRRQKFKFFLKTFILTKTPSYLLNFSYSVFRLPLIHSLVSVFLGRDKSKIQLANALQRRRESALKSSNF